MEIPNRNDDLKKNREIEGKLIKKIKNRETMKMRKGGNSEN